MLPVTETQPLRRHIEITSKDDPEQGPTSGKVITVALKMKTRGPFALIPSE